MQLEREQYTFSNGNRENRRYQKCEQRPYIQIFIDTF